MTRGHTGYPLLPFRYKEAADKARRLYPGVIGQVLASEILAFENLTFLGTGSRSAQLLATIQAMDDVPPRTERAPPPNYPPHRQGIPKGWRP